MPTHLSTGAGQTDHQRKRGFPPLAGGILERDSDLRAKPSWLRSGCDGRAARQKVWHWVGGACQAGGGTDHGRCVVVGAASVYGRKAPSVLGGPRWRPEWAPADVCGHIEESLDPQGLMAARGGGLSDLGAAHRGFVLLPTTLPRSRRPWSLVLLSVCTVFR